MRHKGQTLFKFSKKTALSAITLLMLVYFVFHSIYGSRGIIAYFKAQSELRNAHKKLELVRSKRLEIENRAKLLRPDSLDKDMLDETTRNVLGFSSPKEKVYKTRPIEKKDNI